MGCGAVGKFELKVRGLNRSAYAFLVGTKYDLYTSMPAEEQRDIDKQVYIFFVVAGSVGLTVAVVVGVVTVDVVVVVPAIVYV